MICSKASKEQKDKSLASKGMRDRNRKFTYRNNSMKFSKPAERYEYQSSKKSKGISHI